MGFSSWTNYPFPIGGFSSLTKFGRKFILSFNSIYYYPKLLCEHTYILGWIDEDMQILFWRPLLRAGVIGELPSHLQHKPLIRYFAQVRKCNLIFSTIFGDRLKLVWNDVARTEFSPAFNTVPLKIDSEWNTPPLDLSPIKTWVRNCMTRILTSKLLACQ